MEFFLPLISIQVLNVRSSKFDEECSCRHSYLSSLLTFSRPDPPFRLSSSCHEAGRVHTVLQELPGEHVLGLFGHLSAVYCICRGPSGNLSYSSLSFGTGLDLEEGADSVWSCLGCSPVRQALSCRTTATQTPSVVSRTTGTTQTRSLVSTVTRTTS